MSDPESPVSPVSPLFPLSHPSIQVFSTFKKSAHDLMELELDGENINKRYHDLQMENEKLKSEQLDLIALKDFWIEWVKPESELKTIIEIIDKLNESCIKSIIGSSAKIETSPKDKLNNIFQSYCSENEVSLPIVKKLIQLGAKANFNQSVALIYAIGKGHLDVAQYLIDVGADVDSKESILIRNLSNDLMGLHTRYGVTDFYGRAISESKIKSDIEALFFILMNGAKIPSSANDRVIKTFPVAFLVAMNKPKTSILRVATALSYQNTETYTSLFKTLEAFDLKELAISDLTRMIEDAYNSKSGQFDSDSKKEMIGKISEAVMMKI